MPRGRIANRSPSAASQAPQVTMEAGRPVFLISIMTWRALLKDSVEESETEYD